MRMHTTRAQQQHASSATPMHGARWQGHAQLHRTGGDSNLQGTTQQSAASHHHHARQAHEQASANTQRPSGATGAGGGGGGSPQRCQHSGSRTTGNPGLKLGAGPDVARTAAYAAGGSAASAGSVNVVRVPAAHVATAVAARQPCSFR
jgi:hypothetical protein